MRRFLLMLKTLVVVASLAAVSASAQVSAPSGSVAQQQSQQQPAQMAPMPYGLGQTLNQVQQISQATVNDLGRLRVEKWKVDDRSKDQARANIDSLQRNLTAALPTLIQQVQANPQSVGAVVKLYRNLNAVYDVLSSVSESAGAFGPKDDYRAIGDDTANLDNARRSLADQLEQMAANQDAQLVRLEATIRAQQQQAAAAPPKKVVVDDTTPAKKTSTRKKGVPKPPTTSPQ